jgi:cytoskeletal protein RodZ
MRKDTSQLERRQSEKLVELGDYLRKAREERFLDLEEIASATLIQPRLLRAIEAGQLSQLPEPVYIKGLIKRYADFLGFHGNRFADEFPLESNIRAIHPSWQDSPAAQLRPIHLYVAYILLIITAISGLSYLMNRSGSLARSSGVTFQLPAGSLSKRSQPQPTGAPKDDDLLPTRLNGSSPNPDKPVRVDITLTAQSWLRVDVDGKTEYEGTLPEGSQKTWTADNKLTLRAGNAGGVILAYNNGQPERLGAPGSVKEITFSAPQQSASLPLEAVPIR